MSGYTEWKRKGFSTKTTLLKSAKALLFGGALGFFLFILFRNRQYIDPLAWAQEPILFVLCIGLLFLSMGFNLWGWVLCHQMSGELKSRRLSIAAWVKSIPLRFVPGKVSSVYWRAEIAKRGGESWKAVVVSSVWETYFLFLTAIPFFFVLAHHKGHSFLQVSLFVLFVLLLPFLSSNFWALVPSLRNFRGFVFYAPPFGQAWRAFLIFVVMWIFLGLGFLVLQNIYFNPGPGFGFSPFIPAAGWVAGTLSIIAPRGFGPQEGIGIYFLKDSLTLAQATLLVMAFRILVTMAEMIFWAIYSVFSRSPKGK